MWIYNNPESYRNGWQIVNLMDRPGYYAGRAYNYIAVFADDSSTYVSEGEVETIL